MLFLPNSGSGSSFQVAGAQVCVYVVSFILAIADQKVMISTKELESFLLCCGLALALSELIELFLVTVFI